MLIEKKLVYVNETCHTQQCVLDKIIQDAYTLEYISSKSLFLDAIMKRENIMPTSVGFHVAIPHGRSKAVNKPFVAFMNTKEAFIWNDVNKEMVDLIFLIGVPEENEDNLHLKCLSMISRKLMQDDFRDALRNADHAEAAFTILNEIDKQIRGEN